MPISRLKARSSSSMTMKKKLSFSDHGYLNSRIPRLWPQRRTSNIDTVIVETASVIEKASSTKENKDESNPDTDTEADTGKCPFKHGTVYGESSFPTLTLLVLNVFITMINHSFVFVHKYQHVRTLDTFTATRRRESAQMVADLK